MIAGLKIKHCHLKLIEAVYACSMAARKGVIGSIQHVPDRPIRALALRVARGVAGTKNKARLSLNTLICNCFLFIGAQYDIVLM